MAQSSGWLSLGRFVPSRYDGGTIGRELADWLAERGVKVHRQIGARGPASTIQANENTPQICDWHRDGLADPQDAAGVPSVRILALWSNGTQTQLRDESGALAAAVPGDVILVDNHRIWHRAPPSEPGRWFVRIYDPDLTANLLKTLITSRHISGAPTDE